MGDCGLSTWWSTLIQHAAEEDTTAERLAWLEMSGLRAEVSALRTRAEEAEAEIHDWRSVFGHLGNADEAGNLLRAKQEALERERNEWKARAESTRLGAVNHRPQDEEEKP